MSPLEVVKWLAETSWSTGLHESRYGYPIVESIHVWALCVFFGLAVIFDLRLLGWTMRRIPVSEVSRRLLPWTIAGFVVMVISGTLLFCHSAAVLPEYFLPGQNGDDRAGRHQRLDFPLESLPACYDVGSRCKAAKGRANCRRALAGIVGGRHFFRKNDRVQLVRLRASAATENHQFSDEL